MKMKIVKKELIEFIILGAAALACLLYISFRERGEMNYTLPSFPEIATDDFTRVEIVSPQGEVLRLEKGGGEWILSSGYPADPAVVDRLLEFLAAPVPVDLVSESKKYGRYELDEETRHTLKAYQKENLAREIHLGKVSSSNKYNYVLFPGNENVYTIRGNLVETASKEPKTFRDKLILEVNRAAVSEISYSGAEGEDILLTKGEEASWTDQDGNDWATEKVNEILGRFTSLRAADFPDNPPPESDEIAVITLKGETNPTLRLFKKNDEGYPAISSSYPFPVIISTYIGDSIQEGFAPSDSEE